MMHFRFLLLAGVLSVIGLAAPAGTASANTIVVGAPVAIAYGSDTVEQKKKADTPPRPRPNPGPKDGGEEE